MGEYEYFQELDREAARERAIEKRAWALCEDVNTLRECVFADMPTDLGAALSKFFADRAAECNAELSLAYGREIVDILIGIKDHLCAEAEAQLEIESEAAKSDEAED